jgi:hypothetical protein
MPTLAEKFAAKYPKAWMFTFHKAADILRLFPYRPAVEPCDVADDPDWLVVRPSLVSGAGEGLFTTRFCPKGTRLCQYKGTRLTGLQLLRTPNWKYIANYGFDFFLDAREHPEVKARFVNHHFDPASRNVDAEYVDGNIYFFATRDIEPNEELYLDYGEEYWANHKYWNGYESARHEEPNGSTPAGESREMTAATSAAAR